MKLNCRRGRNAFKQQMDCSMSFKPTLADVIDFDKKYSWLNIKVGVVEKLENIGK